jgi:microcystin-dependent protein|nr:MAG TPA: Baseplate structural protein [Caudoviricetes sp.]
MINVDLIYPIGSIYLSLNDINPNKMFGGTWERIKGKTLVGVDESDTDFKTSKLTGGEKTHKLTIAEMPSHTHDCKTYGNGGVSTKGGGLWGVTDAYGEATNQYPSIYKTGGDQAHNNMQPYYTCFIWYRTA